MGVYMRKMCYDTICLSHGECFIYVYYMYVNIEPLENNLHTVVVVGGVQCITYCVMFRAAPLENNPQTVVVLGGVHWLATHHLTVITSLLTRYSMVFIKNSWQVNMKMFNVTYIYFYGNQLAAGWNTNLSDIAYPSLIQYGRLTIQTLPSHIENPGRS